MRKIIAFLLLVCMLSLTPGIFAFAEENAAAERAGGSILPQAFKKTFPFILYCVILIHKYGQVYHQQKSPVVSP